MNIGLIGLGNVGIEVARRLKSFGSKILAYDPWTKFYKEFTQIGGKMTDSLDALAKISNIISIHVVQNDSTKNLINNKFFAKTKKGILLINTSRSGVICQDSLQDALNKNIVSNYATDVLYPEPPYDIKPENHHYTHPMLNNPRVLVTPHIAASTLDAQKRVAINLVNQIKTLL